MTIHDIINKAEELRRETAIASVDPNRVGTIMSDTLRYINEAQIFADALVHRIYASEEEFANDKEHYSDLTGKPMKAGCIIYIQSTDTFYRYDGDNIKTVLKEKALDTLLAHKANKEGVYPNLIAGDLAGHGESVEAEFSFRASGGKSIKDGTAYIKELLGNAVVWNQLLDNHKLGTGLADKTETDTEVRIIPTDANNRFGNSVNVVEGHYYLQSVDICSENGARVGFQNYQHLDITKKTTSTSYVKLWQIAQASATGISYVQLWSESGTPYRIRKGSFVLRDLTKMFEAGNEPTTIEEYNLRKPIVADEYAYNEGEVIAFCGDAVKSVGDNAWDEQWRQGYFVEGNFYESSSQIASVNPIKVLPNQEYYINQDTLFYWWFYDENMQYVGHTYTLGGVFKVPENAKYMHFNAEPDYGPTYNNDIMIRLDHSGWKSDIGVGYEPYWADTLQIDERIKEAFPQGMHKWDKVYNANGKGYIVKGTGVAHLGDLEWELKEMFGHPVFISERNQLGGTWAQDAAICSLYVSDEYSLFNGADKTMAFNSGYYGSEGWSKDLVVISDLAYTDAASFKAMLQEKQVKLYYELAEPTIEVYDTPFKLDYKVADFGTEELISEQNSAPFKARTIYQFNAVDQIRENAHDIKTLETKIAELQSQIATLLARG